MAIYNDIFSINQVYELMQDGSWVTTPYVPLLNYGWFGGGFGTTSIVDRVDYSADTGTASVRGPLSSARYSLAATGNTTYGWFGGGFVSGPTNFTRVDRVDYSADTATASVRGPLSLGRWGLAASGSNSYGWFGGGYAFTTPAPTYYSRIDRVDYSLDTATASVRGPLSGAKYRLAATANSTYSWFGGGMEVGFVRTSVVDRITYSTDTAVTTSRGPLAQTKSYMSGVGNDNYGWFCGGWSPAAPVSNSIVYRIEYAIDTATASVRGPLSSARYALAASGNNDYAWNGAGVVYPASTSTVDKITYSTDTASAVAKGPLSVARSYLAATGGYPG